MISSKIPKSYLRYAGTSAEMNQMAEEFEQETNFSPDEFHTFFMADDPGLVDPTVNFEHLRTIQQLQTTEEHNALKEIIPTL